MTQRKKSLVVFVEDEPATRTVVEAALDDANFVVFSAADAKEAISILERADGYVGAVFTDVSMPGAMDGLDLAHYVSHRWPSVGLLVTSAKAPRKSIPDGGRFLSKPYDLGRLVNEVRGVIAEAGSPPG
jgi:two-component system, response regulator PdtaR